jgi:hypothetical protein
LHAWRHQGERQAEVARKAETEEQIVQHFKRVGGTSGVRGSLPYLQGSGGSKLINTFELKRLLNHLDQRTNYIIAKGSKEAHGVKIIVSRYWIYIAYGVSAALLILGAFALIIAQGELASGKRTITITGEVVCLPHKKGFFGGVETSECRSGLLSQDGKYYALNFLDSENIERLVAAEGSGQLFTVKGALRIPANYEGLDKYDIAGAVDVTSAISADNSITSVSGCGQRFYIPTPGGKFHSCPGNPTQFSAITEIGGFPACVQMYGSKDEPSRWPTTYDFVLRPNSTGYITVVYDFGINELPTPESFTEIMKKSDIHRLSDDGNSWIFLPANQTSLTVSVAPENVTKVNPTNLKVTYTVETKDTKREEIGNTYLINVLSVCEGELITIDDKPYTGRLPLD